jgi:hypothetical protein
MFPFLNKLLDNLSEYLANRKGLLPLIGLMFIGLDFLLQFFFSGWLSNLHPLLYAGLIIAIFGLMLSQAL